MLKKQKPFLMQMESLPHDLSPTSRAWRELMEEDPIDDKQTHHARSESPTGKKPLANDPWWKVLLHQSPSDELEAASYTEPLPFHKAKVFDEDELLHSSEMNGTRRVTWHHPIQKPWITTKKSTNSRQGSIFGDSGKIFDLLQGGVCNFDTIDLPTCRKVERKLETHLQKMEESGVWKLFESEDTNDPSLASEYSMESNGPISSNGSRPGTISDILEDLESMSASKERFDERSTGSSKYKDLLRKGKSSHNTPLKESDQPQTEPYSGIFSPSRPATPEPASSPLRGALTSSNITNCSNFSRTNRAEETPKFKKNINSLVETLQNDSKTVTTQSSASPSNSEAGENKKPEIYGTEAQNSARKDDPPRADVTHDASNIHKVSPISSDHAQSLPPNPTISGMSTPTSEEEYNASVSMKSCVPPLRSRFSLFRKLTLTKSGSSSTSSSPCAGDSIAVMKVVRKTPSAVLGGRSEAVTTTYVYDYNSSTHAYTAYFHRGEKASTSMRLYEHAKPETFPTLETEVVVQVEVSTVSSSDNAIRRGQWWGDKSRNPISLPIVPGTAFVGKVIQLTNKSNRSGLKYGDRVISLVRVGANSRHLCISHDRLVRIPPDITDPSTLTCLPEVYLTAFQALHIGQKNAQRYRRTSLSGKTILIIGGASVVGRALIEVALAAGAEVVYATGKEKQFNAITEAGGKPLGADPLQWYSLVTGKMDYVICTEDDASSFKYEHVHTLNPKGKLIFISPPDQDEDSVVDLAQIDSKSTNTNRKLYHYNVFDAWESDMKQGKRDLTHLVKLLMDGLLRPRILDRVPLTKVARAQDLLEVKKMNGFVLCEPWIKTLKKESAPADQSDFYVETMSSGSSVVVL